METASQLSLASSTTESVVSTQNLEELLTHHTNGTTAELSLEFEASANTEEAENV